MTTATTEGTARPEAAASTLSNDIGQLLGEFVPAVETPDPETPSEGTTPDAATSDTDAATDAVADGEAAGDPLPSDGTTPDAAATAEATAVPDVLDVDPFADTTAASYVLNGKSVPVEDIRVFKEGGAVIRPESLPNVLSKLAERDTLAERFRTRDSEYQTLAKATEWTDPQGKTLTGPAAAIEMRIGNAGLFAENKLLVEQVIQAEDLQSMLTTKQVMGPDGQAREVVIFRPDAIENLRRENALQQRELAAQIRDHFKTALQSAPVVDYQAAAPDLIQKIAQASNLDASVLTAPDISILAKHLPFHTRNGLASVEWQELVKDRIQERITQRQSQTKVVDATTKAVKEGQARMAAAARGVKPKGAQVARPTSPAKPAPTPQQARMADDGELFDALLRSSSSAMRSAER